MDILVNDNVINSLFNDKQFNKEFKAMLNELIDTELAKDVDQMDCDLIDECTDMLIELEQESDDGFPVIIPPIKAKKIINACTRRDFKSLSRGMRASVVACVILLSAITCNAAIYEATGRNIAQEVATSINQKLNDWGIVSLAEDKPSETPIKEVPTGNENINDDFDDVTEPVTGNENINDDFDEPSTTPIKVPDVAGNENINDDFDDVTEPVTGNENINDDFDEPEPTTQPTPVVSANQYTITFDSAGGSEVPSKLVSYGKAMGALPVPEREGYVFKGWYNIDISYKYNSTFGGAINIKEALPITSDTIYRYKGDAVLTAQWEEAYTITFDAMGGTCDVQSMKVDGSGRLPQLPVPVKEGYVFDYWYYKSGTYNLKQTRVDENTVYTADTKIYARYSVDETEFNLYFCDDGGYQITPEGIETIPIRYGEPYGKLPTPEAPAQGMIFIGWFDGNSITNNQVTEDTIHSSRSDATVWALWAEDVYTLNLDVNGGNEEYEPQQAYLGHGFGNLPTPTRFGYNFRCWTYNGSDISKKTNVPDLSDDDTKELTIVASWSAVNVNITFDGNGGDVRKNSFTYKYDSPFKNFPEATRAGYEFTGWYTDPEEGELITTSSVVNSAEPMVLYAHWAENTENLVYVTFHNNRSIDDTYTVAYEPGTVLGKISAPASTTSTESMFTSFMGWFDDRYYGNLLSEDTVIDEDMHIYAHWKLTSIVSSILKIRVENAKDVYELYEPINFDEIQVTLYSSYSAIEDVSFNELIEEMGDTMEQHFFNADTSTPGQHTMTFKFAHEAFDILGVGTITFEQDVTYTVVGCDHSHTVVKNYIEADCSKKGYTGDVVCEYCDYVVEYGKEIEKVPHGDDTQLEFVKGKEATCTQNGYTDYWRCAVCKEKLKGYLVIPKLNHPSKKLVDAQEATCGQYGYTGDYECSLCGVTLEEGTIIPKLPHGETVLADVKEATCSEKGYTGDFVCSVCGEVMQAGKYTDKLPHAKLEIVDAREATCGQTGYTGYKVCSECGEVVEKGKTVPKLPHGETKLDNVKEPTCTEDGYTGDQVCIVCGQIVTKGEAIACPGFHDIEVKDVVYGGYNKEGYAVLYCNACKETDATSIVYPAVTYIGLEQTAFDYTGQDIKPNVVITDSNGDALSKSNYEVIYPSSSLAPGTYTVTVNFKSVYEGTFELTYTIRGTVAQPKFTGAVCEMGTLTLSWVEPEEADGIEIEIYTFADKRKLNLMLPKGTNSVNLDGTSYYKNAYYAIIRSYTITEENGQQVYQYSDWSEKYRYYKR